MYVCVGRCSSTSAAEGRIGPDAAVGGSISSDTVSCDLLAGALIGPRVQEIHVDPDCRPSCMSSGVRARCHRSNKKTQTGPCLPMCVEFVMYKRWPVMAGSGQRSKREDTKTRRNTIRVPHGTLATNVKQKLECLNSPGFVGPIAGFYIRSRK